MSQLDQAAALVDLGRHANALAVLATAPLEAPAFLLRAQCLLALGQPHDAEHQAREGLALDASGEWGYRLLAYALLAQQQNADAAEAAQFAVAAAPESHLSHVALSDCRRAQSLTGLALASASRAVGLAPDHPESHVALSRSLAAADQLARAEDAARTALHIAPQDEDAAAALGEVLERMFRFEEAQDVRLANVQQEAASAQSTGELADVTGSLLLFAVGANVLLPVALLRDPLLGPLEALGAAGMCWGLVGGVFLVVRWSLQRSMSPLQRRALMPYRRAQEQLFLAALSVPLLVLAAHAAWEAWRRDTSWSSVAAIAGAGVAAYWLGTHGRDRRGGWRAVGTGLSQAMREVALASRKEQRAAVKESRRLLRPVVPVDEDAEQRSPAPTYLRNASYLAHLLVVLLAPTAGAAWVFPTAPWIILPAVLLVAAVDAVVTDNAWPSIARRSRVLWQLDGHHLRVVDEGTGRRPGVGRSALRAVLRLALIPFLLPTAFSRRMDVWVAPHDRWTRTRVVRVLSQSEAERVILFTEPPSSPRVLPT